MIHLIHHHGDRAAQSHLLRFIAMAVVLASALAGNSVAGTVVTTFGDNAIALEPGKMGPNALPVPQVNRTQVGNALIFQSAYENHWDPAGDHTVNPYLYLMIPIKETVGFIIYTRPFETFQTTSALQQLRHADSSSGVSAGDLSFQTMIQLLNEQKSPISLTFNAAVKTTTGKDLNSARHINAPAYFIDFTCGKSFMLDKWNVSFAAMIGFMAWQVNVDMQNDAPYGGVRLELQRDGWTLASEIGGYYGWINNGDHALAASLRVGKSLFGVMQPYVGITYGISDQGRFNFCTGVTLEIPHLGL